MRPTCSGRHVRRASTPQQTEEKLAEVATAHTARIRVIREDGTERFDVDRDQGTDVVHQVGTLVLRSGRRADAARVRRDAGAGARRAPRSSKITQWHVDRRVPPAPAAARTAPGRNRLTRRASRVFRDDLLRPPPVSPDVETGCRTSPAGKLLVCHAARAVAADDGVEAIYVQESSRRAVRALYDLRYQLLRLSLIMLPFALGFSWWMGAPHGASHRVAARARPREGAQRESARRSRRRRPVTRSPISPRRSTTSSGRSTNDGGRTRPSSPTSCTSSRIRSPPSARAPRRSTAAASTRSAPRGISKILGDSSTRLDALVSQFLELARAEAGMPNEARGTVDLAALARGITGCDRSEPPRSEVRRWTPKRRSTWSASSRVSTPLVRNLVDNAASFAGAGGEVRVSVKPDAEDARQVRPRGVRHRAGHSRCRSAAHVRALLHDARGGRRRARSRRRESRKARASGSRS